jgi:mono/diheme cytochrome c family protein
MTDDDIAAVINYERSSWGNTGAQVTAAQVAAIRAATATRTTPWTEAELKQYR